MRLIGMAILLAAALPFAAAADDRDWGKEPGYIDFGDIAKFSNGQRTVEIRLTQPLLSLAKLAIEEDEPEFAELVESLELIRVDAFSFDTTSKADLERQAESIEQALGEKDWQRVVSVKEDDERVHVYLKPLSGSGEDDVIAGVAVVALEPDKGEGNQAVFVNVVGRFDVKAVGKLMGNLNVPDLDEFQHFDFGRAEEKTETEESEVVIE
jgi:hypothetical protein